MEDEEYESKEDIVFVDIIDSEPVLESIDVLHNSVPIVNKIADIVLKELIVYTTRLDDMKIWKEDLDNMSIQDITSCITFESKPKFTGYLEDYADRVIHSQIFSNLMKKIDEVNQRSYFNVNDVQNISIDDHSEVFLNEYDMEAKIKKESCKPLFDRDFKRGKKYRNKHLKICKPCFVVLEDIRYKLKCTKVQNTSDHGCMINRTKRPKSLRQIDLYDVDDGHSSSANVTISNGCVVKIKDLASSFYEIYYINENSIPTEYYRYNNEIPLENFLKDQAVEKFLELNNCCWYRRQQRIKEIAVNHSYTISSLFMSKHHPCEPRKCNCCCRRKYEDVLILSETSHSIPRETTKQFTNVSDPNYKNQWNKRIIKLSNPTNWISKALTYKKDLSQKIKPINQSKNNCNTTARLNIHVSKGNTLLYEISNKEIKSYYELNHFAQKNMLNKYIGNDLPKVNVVDSVCCWHNYKNIIRSLSSRLSPNVVRYLTKSHHCDPCRCSCCCKPEEDNGLNNKRQKDTVSLELPNIPKHTSNCVLDVLLTRKKRKHISYFNKTIAQKSAPPNTSDRIDQLVVQAPQKAVEQLGTENMPSVSCGSKNDATTTTSSVYTQIETVSMSKRILRDFDELSIIVYPNGIVKVKPKFLPETMASESLIVLKYLLRHVQNHIKSRKLPSVPVSVDIRCCINDETIENSLSAPFNGNENMNKKQHTVIHTNTNVNNNNIKLSKKSGTTSLPNFDLAKYYHTNQHANNLYQICSNLMTEKKIAYLKSFKSVLASSAEYVGPLLKNLDNNDTSHQNISKTIANLSIICPVSNASKTKVNSNSKSRVKRKIGNDIQKTGKRLKVTQLQAMPQTTISNVTPVPKDVQSFIIPARSQPVLSPSTLNNNMPSNFTLIPIQIINSDSNQNVALLSPAVAGNSNNIPLPLIQQPPITNIPLVMTTIPAMSPFQSVPMPVIPQPQPQNANVPEDPLNKNPILKDILLGGTPSRPNIPSKLSVNPTLENQPVTQDKDKDECILGV